MKKVEVIALLSLIVTIFGVIWAVFVYVFPARQPQSQLQSNITNQITPEQQYDQFLKEIENDIKTNEDEIEQYQQKSNDLRKKIQLLSNGHATSGIPFPTGTIVFESLASKLNQIQTSEEKDVFLSKFQNQKIYGEGTLEDKYSPQDNGLFQVLLRAPKYYLACEFSSSTKAKLALIEIGELVRFSGIFESQKGPYSIMRRCELE